MNSAIIRNWHKILKLKNWTLIKRCKTVVFWAGLHLKGRSGAPNFTPMMTSPARLTVERTQDQDIQVIKSTPVLVPFI